MRNSQNLDFELIRIGAECNSVDQNLGDKRTVDECAAACQNIPECKFFVYGYTGDALNKAGWCYWEKTTSEDCPEGWELGTYGFYRTGRLSLYFNDFEIAFFL